MEAEPAAIESSIGGLNEEAVNKVFTSLDKPIQGCLAEGASKLSVLGGQFKVKMNVRKEGELGWAYLSESTLGDRQTETCVLNLLRQQQWPKPVGGDGIAERSYEMDPNTKPGTIELKWVRQPIAKVRIEAWKCRKGVRGKFYATAYLRPDGRVLTAGVAPPDERGEDVADCVVKAIHKVRFGKIGKKAKLSFEIY